MSTTSKLPERLTGANFLLEETDPSSVFTREDLSLEEKQMSETAARFMEKEVLPRLDALEHQEDGLALKLFKQASELGLLAIEFPEEHGGLGMHKRASIGVSEQLSRLGGFGITCGAHSGIGSQPLIYFGTPEQKAKYLPRLATGELMAAYCLSEAGSGSDALGMKTKAVLSPDGKHYILNGVKMWITNAAWADLFTVFAKVDGEHVSAFLVEKNFPGVSTGAEEHKLGIKTSSTRRLVLEDVAVPVENLLGEVGKGAYIAFNILNFGRYSLAAGVVGAARDQIRHSAKYAMERHQFGRPIGSFGLIQDKLAGMASKIYAAESATYRTAGLIDEVFEHGEMLDSMKPNFPRALDEFAIECSALKFRCTEIGFEVADESIQIHGGFGFTEEFPAARALRDSRINRIFEGTNEINRLFIPATLMRRDQRDRFPLMKTALALSLKRLFLRGPSDSGDVLKNALATLANAKKLVFLFAGTAGRKFGKKIIEEQEVLGALSDIIADLYLAESGVLRAMKARAKAGSATAHTDLAVLYVNDYVVGFESHARRLLEVCVEPKDVISQLSEARKLLGWQPLNTTALRRKVAQTVCDRGGCTV
ncbi:MAG: acyl-CoA dehydrogenase family protein [Candidatus Didemnitutus sp.]|nr:acyl-CoA dehydrogenase family protein [Candidatus Didemnitutus sp.]